MTSQQRFRSARDVLAAASEAHQPRSGEAEALPLPRSRGVDVVVLYYREGMRPGEETVYPPHHQVTVDAATCEVVESRPCTPAELGVAKATGEPTAGFGLDPSMPAAEFWERMARFRDLSAAVWELYADGVAQLDPSGRALVADYAACLRRVTKAPLTPYYEAVAGDFLEWLERVLT
jgi:hypothetical protein